VTRYEYGAIGFAETLRRKAALVTDAQGSHDPQDARMAALLPGGEPVEPGTGGRQWRKIGVPY